jgi:hypothetical protein
MPFGCCVLMWVAILQPTNAFGSGIAEDYTLFILFDPLCFALAKIVELRKKSIFVYA